MEISWGHAAARTGPDGRAWFHEILTFATLRCGNPLSRLLDAVAQDCGDNRAMDIQINGQTFALPDRATITTLLASRDLAGTRVAVEVNGAIVPRGQHSTHQLNEGDRVEIVQALGGG